MSEKGIFVSQPREIDRGRILEYAEMAEDHGFDTVWFGESWGRDSTILATQIAERTSRIDLCAGIFNTYTRTPALLAMGAAGLSDVSGGRYRLGLGPSGPNVIEGLHGQPFDAPVERLAEYVEIVTRFVDGETVDYDGRFFTPEGYHISPRPEHEVPIYLGVNGDRNLALTGELADGWLPLMVPVHGFEDALETVGDAAREQGRSLADVDVAPYVVACISAADPDESERHAKRTIARYVGVMGEYFYRNARKYGYGDEADAIRTAWQGGDRSAAVDAVTDEMVAAFAITGSPDRAKEKVEEYREVGVDHPIAFVPPTVPDDLFRETIEHF